MLKKDDQVNMTHFFSKTYVLACEALKSQCGWAMTLGISKANFLKLCYVYYKIPCKLIKTAKVALQLMELASIINSC